MSAVSLRIRLLAEKLFALRINRIAGVPHGIDLYIDLRRDFPELNVECVFDVGANVGQSAGQFVQRFPNATIYSLEPASATYRKLCTATAREPRIRPFQVALGDINDRLPMATQPGSVLNSLASTDLMTGSTTEELVNVRTLDRFAAEHGIKRVNFLKVDVEGYELQVLRGATRLLESGEIDLVQLECGFGVTAVHVALDTFIDFLRPYSYQVYGIYEQSKDWRPGAGRRLMYANVVFARNATAASQAPS